MPKSKKTKTYAPEKKTKCEICNIMKIGIKVGDSQLFGYYISGKELYSIWYEHKSVDEVKEKKLVREMQGRLIQEASRYFKTNDIEINSNLKTHIHYIAKIK